MVPLWHGAIDPWCHPWHLTLYRKTGRKKSDFTIFLCTDVLFDRAGSCRPVDLYVLRRESEKVLGIERRRGAYRAGAQGVPFM
jgi:hypothetical protein